MAYVKVPAPGCQQQEYAGLCQQPSCCYCCSVEGAAFRECECSECSRGAHISEPRADVGHRLLPPQTNEVRKPREDYSYLLPEKPTCIPKCQNAQSNYAQWPYCQKVVQETSSSNAMQFCETKSFNRPHQCELGQCNTKYACDDHCNDLKVGLNGRSCGYVRCPELSENVAQFKETHAGRPSGCHGSQVLAEIQCHRPQGAAGAGQELARASQQLREAATSVEGGWPDRQHYQQELEAVRSQLRSLRNHSAIALHKEPGESKRLRRESGGASSSSACPKLLPTTSSAAIKRPRDLSPKLPAIRSVNSQSGVWLCQEMSDALPESEQSSDAALGEDELEEEDGRRRMTDGGSESGSNTPSLVGETLGSISLSEPALGPPRSHRQAASYPDASAITEFRPPGEDLPPLRNSLFSHVPPYVRFHQADSVQGCSVRLPPEVQRLLKWKLSPITPLVVRRTLLQSSFRLVRTSSDWCGTWGKHMKSACFGGIKEFQKMNHFPGTFQIGRKDRLWRNLHRLMVKFGKKEFGFMPRTFILPQDLRLLRQAWEKTCGIERWIVKPPASARGTGIRVVHKWSQIPKKRPLVVQRYIAQPYLINGSKFDLRLYVFVSSIDPLRIYMYDDGLVRFASVKYSSEMTSLHDRYMHLTNYSINKNSSQYTQNEDADACQGHKWTVKSLWSYLAGQGVDVAELWGRLEDLVVKTLISGESAISALIREHVSSRYSCYELFGVDVLLDDKLRPWLLEVNISPSLHSASPLDQAVKGPLVCDLLNMAGYHVPNKLPASMQRDLLRTLAPDCRSSQLCLDPRLYYLGLSRDEANKQLHFTKEGSTREDYLGQILQNLTPDDVRHLVQAEDELSQAGRFLRIFPTPDSHFYHQFFEGPRYYNMLFDAWENRYHSNRAPGIALLEEQCKQKVHLNIPALSARAKSCAESETAAAATAGSGSSSPSRPECGGPAGSQLPPPQVGPQDDSETEDEDGEENTETDRTAKERLKKSTASTQVKFMRFMARSVLMRAKRQRYPRWVTTVRAPPPPRSRPKVKSSPPAALAKSPRR